MNWRDFEWIGYHKLYRIITIEGAVENIEPLHIGAGKKKGWEVADLIVLKVTDPKSGKEVPVIPGSSWKGIFRAEAVAIARQNDLDVCDGLPRATCLEGREFDEIEKSYSPAECLEMKLRGIVEGTISEFGKGVCLLCLIFGTPGLRSHVQFYDSVPVGNYKLGYRRSVAISRRTGAAAYRSLFTVEYVEPGSIFNFRLTAINLPNYALGLLSTIMKEINLGIVKVGGLKSRGYGTVKFIEKKFKISVSGIKGVKDEVLEALDPYDFEIKMSSSVLEGSEAWKILEDLASVWIKSLSKLREVSKKGWRWVEPKAS